MRSVVAIAVTSNCRESMFGAIGKSCAESVVLRYRRR